MVVDEDLGHEEPHMSKTKERITQVRLERRYDTNGYTLDVAWIRSDLARVGKRVYVEDDDRVWTITEVYGTRDADDLEWLYKAWREFATKLGC